MSPTVAILDILALLAFLGLGTAFHAVASAVLRLNRARMLRLFGDEEPEITAEEAILRDTKDIYFVARLGLAAALVGTGFCTITLASAIAGHWWGPATPGRHALESAVAILVATPLFLFCAFGVPRIAMRRNAIQDDEYELPRWMEGFLRIVRPLTSFSRLGDLLPMGQIVPRHQLSKSELVALVTDLDIEDEEPENGDEEEGESEASPSEEDNDEDEIVYNILDLDETFVREVMKPINSVVAVRLQGATIEGVKALARRTGYSRFPVFKDRIVNLVGYVSIYDVLRADSRGKELDEFVSPVFFVPEFMRVSRLLREFLDRRIKAAVVVDEHGGTSGWVTREDVFEEIVGEIEDEFDTRRAEIEQVDDSEWLVNGDTDIDDLNEDLPIAFDEAIYDTVAGFILHSLGEIPEPGDTVETEEATYTVENTEGNRITRVRIRLREQDEGEEGGDQ